MITKTELYQDGHKEVYHRAGTLVVDGVEFPDQKFSWTHPYAERATCSACIDGNIPTEIRNAKP